MRRALAALALAALTGCAHAIDACAARAELLGLGVALKATRAQLAAGAPLRVLALGSSSTAGEGASSPLASYPAVLSHALERAARRARVQMINAGVSGDTALAMRNRLEREIDASRPQLVLWQTGANDAMRGVDPDAFERSLESGLRYLRSRDLDVVLIPPQYAPAVERAPVRDRYISIMRKLAAEHGAGFFERYLIMRETAHADRLAHAAQIGPDGLHHTDLGYRCLGEQLARAIGRASGHDSAR